MNVQETVVQLCRILEYTPHGREAANFFAWRVIMSGGPILFL
jgi:hypothetical protein